jgi:hypothetical protein
VELYLHSSYSPSWCVLSALFSDTLNPCPSLREVPLSLDVTKDFPSESGHFDTNHVHTVTAFDTILYSPRPLVALGRSAVRKITMYVFINRKGKMKLSLYLIKDHAMQKHSLLN